VRVSDILAQDMVALKLLGPIRWVAAGAPEYFDKFGRPEHPRDLHSHNCISAGIHLYFPRRSQVHPKLRAFIEHVKERSTDI
jgi:DNA-binding transcriptional LysR family regulator